MERPILHPSTPTLYHRQSGTSTDCGLKIAGSRSIADNALEERAPCLVCFPPAPADAERLNLPSEAEAA